MLSNCPQLGVEGVCQARSRPMGVNMAVANHCPIWHTAKPNELRLDLGLFKPRKWKAIL